jgi:WD40 repeat protein
LRWSSDGNSLIFGPRFSNEVQRYDGAAAKLGEPIRLTSTGMCALDWSRDGRYVVTGGDSRVVQFVDLETATVVALGQQAHGITGVRFTPDEKQVCSVGYDGCVRFWTRDGKADRVFEAISAPIRCIDWSGDGKLLVTGHEDNTIRFWNNEGVAEKVIGGHGGYVQALDFSPDSKQLASGGWDHTIRIWKRDGSPVSVLRGHEGRVFAVQWTPDGRKILSGADDGILRCWNPATGQAEWQILFGDTGSSVTLDAQGHVKHGNEQILETDFVFFAEDGQGRLVRTSWAEIRAALPPAAAPTESP